MKSRWILKVLGILLVLAIVAVGFGSAVLYLWNWLMPALFGLHTVTYWQALGLLGLSWFLFGGPRLFSHREPYWRYRMQERWAQMTPEEREKFRQGMRHRCGRPEKPAANPTE